MGFKNILDQANSGVENAKYQVESLYNSLSDSVGDVVDFTSATFQRVYESISVIYEVAKLAGITIALVAAPVPTFVALSILWLMELSVDSVNADIDQALKDKQKKREFNRIVKTLKKYGKLPRTAIVETNEVRMDINSVTGQVDGRILSGKYSGREFSHLNNQELLEIASESKDKDTESLIDSYISYREKAKCINL